MASTVWKGFITFGLISIPVRLLRAARPERVKLRQLERREKRAPAKKGYEYAKGDFVTIDKEELKAIEAKTTPPSTSSCRYSLCAWLKKNVRAAR